MTYSLQQLVSDLPEIYQPVYGHPELSGKVARECSDRLIKIVEVHDALQTVLGRPLSVLDLGCAQGFFSLNLACRGSFVHGVDYLDKNVAVCQALAKEQPHLKVSFEIARIENIVERLEMDQYDLVLGLSVFHHIVHENGVTRAQALLKRIAQSSGALVIELALRDEPLYWATAQPEDPRTLLAECPFVHELARHLTHLAPILRPLYVASNRYWVLDGHAGRFESWTTDPHAVAKGAHQGSRRYFFSNSNVIKIYRFDHLYGPRNRYEMTGEIEFLKHPPENFQTPAHIVSGLNETEGWLVMERIHGRLLLDLLREGVSVDHTSILRAVLKQLVTLETSGLYHDDIRAWNILITNDGAPRLIDYGSISPKARDCVWPENIFLAFFIFVREVATGVVDDPDPLRTISISPYSLPSYYRAWATSLWKHPLKEWSFKLMLETLDVQPEGLWEEVPEQPQDAWAQAIEGSIQTQKKFIQHLKYQIEDKENKHHKIHQSLAETQGREFASLELAITHWGQSLLSKMTFAENFENRLAHAETLAQEQERRAVAAEIRSSEQEQRAVAAEARSSEQEQRAVAAEARSSEQEQRIHELEANSHHWWQQACGLESERNALRQSWSWRITAPGRFVGALAVYGGPSFRSCANRTAHFCINALQRPLAAMMRTVFRHPGLRYRLSQCLLRYPALYQQLLGVARNEGVIPGLSAHLPQSPYSRIPEDKILDHLTPHARQIYQDLKMAIELRQKKED